LTRRLATGYGMDGPGLSASRSSLMTAEFPVAAI